jgi:hypothetical protein
MMQRRIDVHQHIVPPAHAAWLRSRGIWQDAEGLFDQFAPERT